MKSRAERPDAAEPRFQRKAPTREGRRQEEQKNTAHVRVYAEREQLLTRAPALAKEGRYAEALALYEEAVEKEPDAVIPLDKARGCGVREYVLAQIASWPEGGKLVCRRKADPRAERLFNAARQAQDIPSLERLIEEYPLSSYVNEALSLIANFRLDAGEEDRAAVALAALLAREGEAPRPATLARLGLLYSRTGQKALLEDLLDRAAREHKGARIRIAGGETDLAAHLRKLLLETRERKTGPVLSIPCWDMPGGAPSGARLAEPGVTLARPAWRYGIDLPRFDSEDESGGRRGPALALPKAFRPLFPAVADGILYVHTDTSLYAFNLFARQADLLWQYRVPAPTRELMFDDRALYATTVHEGRVLANFVTSVGDAEDQLGYVRVKFPFPRRALFALDAYSGKLLWKLGGQPKGETLEEIATFAVPPTPDHDRLYVGAVFQKQNTDPFKHYVLCLDAATGRILWSTFVASGGTEINLFGNSTRESLGSPVSMDDESVYYCTNHGAIAALEKKTGRLRWTYRYRQIPVNPTRSVYVTRNRLEWTNAPPVVARGVLAVTPTDSPNAVGLEARGGKLIWENPRRGGVRSVFGVKDATLVLGGERVEFYDIQTGELLASQASDDLSGSGRGGVAEDGVYVPGREKFYRVKFDGTVDERATKAWAHKEGGNLIVVDGAIVLATQDSIEVHFDRRDQEKAIRTELAGDPDNPAALYRAALRLLQSGSPSEAANLLRQVIGLTAKGTRPEEELLRRAAGRRLYSVSMEGGRAEMEAGTFDSAAERFATAREAAPDAASRIEATLLLGRAHAARRDFERAVDEFQRLIAEQGEVPVAAVKVFDLARDAIEGVLKTAGRDVYARYEKEAEQSLARARQEGTPEMRMAVFKAWPNSVAAEAALYESAAAGARLGRGDQEVESLRRFIVEYPGSSRAPEAHASLVRALEKRARYGAARSLLRRMDRAFPEAEVGDGEARVKVRDFAERRLKSEAYAARTALPPAAELSPPLRKVFEYADREFREGVPLAAAGALPAGTADLLFMNYGGAVKAFDLKRGAEAWRLKTAAGGVRAAFFAEDSLILAEENAVRRINPKDGAVEWTYASKTAMQGFVLADSALCFLASEASGENTVTALDADRGVPIWSQTVEGSPAPRTPIFAAEDAIFFPVFSPNRLYSFEAGTGKKLLGASFTQGGAARLLHVSDTRALLLWEGRFLEAYGRSDGEFKWRVPLKGWTLRAIEAGTSGIVMIGVKGEERAGKPQWGDPEEAFLAVVDPGNGKLIQMTERFAVGDPRFMMLEGNTAYVVSRELGSGALSTRAVRLPEGAVEWTAVSGENEALLLPPALTKGHIMLGFFQNDSNAKFGYGGILLDKAGKGVQNMKSGFLFDRPPNGAVSDGRLIFSADNRVEVYR